MAGISSIIDPNSLVARKFATGGSATKPATKTVNLFGQQIVVPATAAKTLTTTAAKAPATTAKAPATTAKASATAAKAPASTGATLDFFGNAAPIRSQMTVQAGPAVPAEVVKANAPSIYSGDWAYLNDPKYAGLRKAIQSGSYKPGMDVFSIASRPPNLTGTGANTLLANYTPQGLKNTLESQLKDYNLNNWWNDFRKNQYNTVKQGTMVNDVAFGEHSFGKGSAADLKKRSETPGAGLSYLGINPNDPNVDTIAQNWIDYMKAHPEKQPDSQWIQEGEWGRFDSKMPGYDVLRGQFPDAKPSQIIDALARMEFGQSALKPQEFDFGKIIDTLATVALGVINPALGAAYSAIKTGVEGGGIGDIILSGMGGYAGGQFGANLAGNIASTGGIASGLLETVKDTAGNFVDSLGNVVDEAGRIISNPFGELSRGVDFVGNKVTHIGDELSQFGNDPFGYTKSAITNEAGKVWNDVTQKWEDIKAIPGKISDTVSDAWKDITHLPDTISNAWNDRGLYPGQSFSGYDPNDLSRATAGIYVAPSSGWQQYVDSFKDIKPNTIGGLGEDPRGGVWTGSGTSADPFSTYLPQGETGPWTVYAGGASGGGLGSLVGNAAGITNTLMGMGNNDIGQGAFNNTTGQLDQIVTDSIPNTAIPGSGVTNPNINLNATTSGSGVTNPNPNINLNTATPGSGVTNPNINFNATTSGIDSTLTNLGGLGSLTDLGGDNTSVTSTTPSPLDLYKSQFESTTPVGGNTSVSTDTTFPNFTGGVSSSTDTSGTSTSTTPTDTTFPDFTGGTSTSTSTSTTPTDSTFPDFTGSTGGTGTETTGAVTDNGGGGTTAGNQTTGGDANTGGTNTAGGNSNAGGDTANGSTEVGTETGSGSGTGGTTPGTGTAGTETGTTGGATSGGTGTSGTGDTNGTGNGTGNGNGDGSGSGNGKGGGSGSPSSGGTSGNNATNPIEFNPINYLRATEQKYNPITYKRIADDIAGKTASPLLTAAQMGNNMNSNARLGANGNFLDFGANPNTAESSREYRDWGTWGEDKKKTYAEGGTIAPRTFTASGVDAMNPMGGAPAAQYGVSGLASLVHGGVAKDKPIEGYLNGPGDGMSDSIKATIDGHQPARLADGEFVIPADVVSHLGNGSSKAGAKVLYAMMDRIRQARTGNPKQGKEIKPNKFLPA